MASDRDLFARFLEAALRAGKDSGDAVMTAQRALDALNARYGTERTLDRAREAYRRQVFRECATDTLLACALLGSLDSERAGAAVACSEANQDRILAAFDARERRGGVVIPAELVAWLAENPNRRVELGTDTGEGIQERHAWCVDLLEGTESEGELSYGTSVGEAMAHAVARTRKESTPG